MVSTAPPTPLQDNAPSAADDWPVQVADSIERVVGTVRDKTTGPALTVARGIVYGTFATVVGLAVLVVFVIALVRVVDAYLPDAVFGETHTWATHLILGVLFSLAGLVLWLRRHPREQSRRA